MNYVFVKHVDIITIVIIPIIPIGNNIVRTYIIIYTVDKL